MRHVSLPGSSGPLRDMLSGMTGRAISRRAVLATMLLVPVMAACSGGSSPEPSPTPEDPDLAIRARIVQQEDDLIAAYDTAIRQFPELAEDLTPLRDQHLAHRAALVDASASASTSASPSPGASSPAETLAALAAAEAAAADGCTTACVKSASAQTARLMALIAASEESHVPYIDGIVL